ncbi:RDD family protein [Candidatus Nitronereus thalassa]|uniref:RDD family protein n=1 Tax=Candidatus Nitronereus thalassa TaxID=3020898 RepID=A0ABU3K6W5_9BACT|nr:RDD family protein [Candidatus Nitronereus thalassa]MDT7042136.1 RDD family protein [Candidatus Nitronereus thalassa]
MRTKREYTKAWPPIEPPELKGAYVGFWARFMASLLDTVLLTIVTYPLLLVVYGWGYLESWALVEGSVDLLLSWMFPAAAVVMFWIYCSATPGKMAIGARLVDSTTGGQPTQRQLVKRYIGYFVSSIPLCWGFIHAAFDPRKQGWHDKLAGTVVVYTKKIRQPQEESKVRAPIPGQFEYATSSSQLYPSLGEPHKEKIVVGVP